MPAHSTVKLLALLALPPLLPLLLLPLLLALLLPLIMHESDDGKSDEGEGEGAAASSSVGDLQKMLKERFACSS
jgi:hypothetical protein